MIFCVCGNLTPTASNIACLCKQLERLMLSFWLKHVVATYLWLVSVTRARASSWSPSCSGGHYMGLVLP